MGCRAHTYRDSRHLNQTAASQRLHVAVELLSQPSETHPAHRDGGTWQALPSQNKQPKPRPVVESEFWDLSQSRVGVEGKKPSPPFPGLHQMVCAPFELLSRKGPSRGKLRSEPHVLPLLKACHPPTLNTNLTNTLGVPKLLGDTLYFLNTSGCCNAKLSCAACLHFFLHTFSLPALPLGRRTQLKTSSQRLFFTTKIHIAAPDVRKTVSIKRKKKKANTKMIKKIKTAMQQAT